MLSFSPLRPWRSGPSPGRAGLAVRPPRSPFTKAPVSVNGQAGRRPSRTLCMGAGAVGRRLCGVEGLRGRVSPHSRVPGKPARGSRAVACGFGRAMRRDRVQAGPGRGWPRAPLAQPQSFGSEWRLSEGGGGDTLF